MYCVCVEMIVEYGWVVFVLVVGYVWVMFEVYVSVDELIDVFIGLLCVLLDWMFIVLKMMN